MKFAGAAGCAGLFLFFSVVLHGCDFGDTGDKPAVAEEEKEVEKDIKEVIKAVAPKKKASASCKNGNFKCDGGWRQWCGRMKKKCGKKECAPMCTWKCDSPACSQQCGPVCNQPECSTRCKGFNTDSCKMKCGKPNCRVVCPKHFCPQQDCAACKTECGKPACKMECGSDHQPCRTLCAQPVCKWECKHPNLCPKPKCAMTCKKASDCAEKNHMSGKIPPLEPGETEVVTVDAGGPSPAPAPASFLQQGHEESMRVNFTTMGEDGSVHAGQIKLAMVQVDANDGEEDTWSREVTEAGGQVTESQASCSKGVFRCQGNDSWCTEQKKLLCEDVSLRRSPSQGHLQA